MVLPDSGQMFTPVFAIAPLVIPAISGIVSLLSGLFGGKKTKQTSTQASKGARLQDILPLLMPLLQQQQRHSDQNYQQQQDKYQQTVPLQGAITNMANGLLPRQYQGPRPPQMPGQ